MDKKLPRLLNDAELAGIRAMSMEHHGLGIYQYTFEGVITYIDRVTLKIFDLSDEYPDPSMAVGKKISDLICYAESPGSIRAQVREQGHVYGNKYHYKTLKGGDRWCIHDACLVMHPETGEELVHIVVRDITKLMLAEEEKTLLQNQLYQAQKMEAIGLLAGGIAHDFNNILHIIINYGEIALSETAAGQSVTDSVEEILKAGNRAKVLVSQLLAYSRQQVLSLEVLNLCELVRDMLNMLNRVIGESIEVHLNCSDDCLEVEADSGQIGQILTNLCINARDAIDGSGEISIDVYPRQISKDYCELHPWAFPGKYVVLAVTDTGCGMSPETQAQIFEPFYTTKEIGKGSGLGLSTVYGLVNQHHGFIHVYSEPGQGTTFRIYIPQAAGKAVLKAERADEQAPRSGSETILLAEDDFSVRTLTRKILTQNGYRVIEAGDGMEAVEAYEQHSGEIDLLLFDVIMPKLGGREAYERIRRLNPDVRILFTSGYSMNAIHTNFVLDKGLMLLPKPAGYREILSKVREALGQ